MTTKNVGSWMVLGLWAGQIASGLSSWATAPPTARVPSQPQPLIHRSGSLPAAVKSKYDGGSMVEVEVGSLVDARSRTKATSMHVTASWAGQSPLVLLGYLHIPPLAFAMTCIASLAVVNYINSSFIGPDSNYPYSHST